MTLRTSEAHLFVVLNICHTFVCAQWNHSFNGPGTSFTEPVYRLQIVNGDGVAPKSIVPKLQINVRVLEAQQVQCVLGWAKCVMMNNRKWCQGVNWLRLDGRQLKSVFFFSDWTKQVEKVKPWLCEWGKYVIYSVAAKGYVLKPKGCRSM